MIKSQQCKEKQSNCWGVISCLWRQPNVKSLTFIYILILTIIFAKHSPMIKQTEKTDNQQEPSDDDNQSTTSSAIVKHLQDLQEGYDEIDDEKQQFRALNFHNQPLGFSFFTNDTSGLNDTSFGFQNGHLKNIQINHESLKQAMLLLQSQSQELPENSAKKHNDMTMQSFNFSFGFSKGNGESLGVSASKLKQAEMFLKSQSQQLILIDIDKSSDKKSQKRKSTATPRLYPIKTTLKEQRTLQSHRKANRLSKLLIISDSKPGTKHKILDNKYIQYLSSYQKVKLDSLQQKKIDLLDFQDPKLFYHSIQTCCASQCYLCDEGIEMITSEEIIKILRQKFGEQLDSKLRQWYHQISLKLFKYQKNYPYLINKRFSAVNIISELQKKYRKQQTSMRQPFGLSLRKGTFMDGLAVNLIILSIHFVKEKQYYLIQLSDGWYSFYAPIKIERKIKKNSYYICKLIQNGYIYPGRKVQTSSWRQYPVQGILQYLKCPNHLPSIDLMFNSLIKIPDLSKLGFSNIVFYKSLQKCYPNCGLIMLCSLMVIRIFILNENQNLYLRVSNQNDNYLLIIKGGAGLVDEISEKHQYQFRNIKILPESELESTRITRFSETIMTMAFGDLLQNLLWNTSARRYQNRIYDIILEIVEIKQHSIRGIYKNQEVRIQILNSKLKVGEEYLGKNLLFVQIKHIVMKYDGTAGFCTTPLTKFFTNSKHKLYQQLLRNNN